MPAPAPPGLSLTYSTVSLPGGLSINPSTGLISGTITSSRPSHNGPPHRHAPATGSTGGVLLLDCGPSPPLLETLPNQDNDVGDAVQLQAYFGGGPAWPTADLQRQRLAWGLEHQQQHRPDQRHPQRGRHHRQSLHAHRHRPGRHPQRQHELRLDDQSLRHPHGPAGSKRSPTSPTASGTWSPCRSTPATSPA